MPPKQSLAKRPRPLDEDEINDVKLVRDTYDRSILLDTKTDICAMCKGDHAVGLSLKEKVVEVNHEDSDDEERYQIQDAESAVDVNYVWASRYSLQQGRRLFVHFYCALASPLAAYDGKTWGNVSREIYRGRGLACRSCGIKGATLGCFEQRCNVVMHVPCAVKQGFRRCGYKVSYYCEEHTKAKEEKERKLDAVAAGDVSRGLEPVPVSSKNTVDDATAMSALRYTKVNVDSDDVIVNSRSVLLPCCKCDGLCDDVATCACLAPGRNYTFTGGLIPGTERRILECNIRCSCSVRRCTNRVVEKGPTARLEIFRIAGSPKTGNTWGVKTLDFIRANSFVCEVTGQYVTGHTADGAGTVADTILSGASKSAGKEAAGVIPVAAWDAAQPDGFSPVAWAAGEVDSKRRGEDEPAPNGPVSRPLTLRELQKDKERYEAVRGFLQGQICIDSRVFGNVGAFIRRRERVPTPAAASSTSASGGIPQGYTMPPPLLLRRLVYTNPNDPNSGLKLALFAARNIAPNTELLI